MKRTPLEYEAIIYFKGNKGIKEKIYFRLRKKYKLSDEQLNYQTREIYNDILERFVKDETKRLTGNKAKLIEFDLNKTKLNKYIDEAVNSLKLFPVEPDVNTSEKRISENQIIKNMVSEKQKADSNKSLTDIYFEIADETGKEFDNIKRLHNYQPKK
ncbi:MAG: hypothetical protein M5U17_10795 [Ignavibacterium sp.]|nr:hypothetical protein [Ignavibacterium sp.]